MNSIQVNIIYYLLVVHLFILNVQFVYAFHNNNLINNVHAGSSKHLPNRLVLRSNIKCKPSVHSNANTSSFFFSPDGHVIIQTPVQPVTEGQNVTLRCKTSYNLNHTLIYKDGVNISDYNLMMESVTKAREGFYKCINPTAALESPESWLSVRGKNINSALFSIELTLFCRPVVFFFLSGRRHLCRYGRFEQPSFISHICTMLYLLYTMLYTMLTPLMCSIAAWVWAVCAIIIILLLIPITFLLVPNLRYSQHL